VSNVTWTLKDPLEPGQKIVLMVSLDTLNPPDVWGINPADGPNDLVSIDKLWGQIENTVGTFSGWLPLVNNVGAQPVAVTDVEVRVYFDLSGSNVYNHYYAGTVKSDKASKPLELDSLGLELVPKPATF
jgi:hypothetical protein